MMGSRRYLVGIDVGGTSVKPVLVEITGSSISETPAWEPDEAPKTQKGVTPHAKQIAEIIKQAQTKALSLGGMLGGVGIGGSWAF